MSHPLPSGFQYSGIACGIKNSGKPDLAMIVGDQPVVAAGVYTQNVVHAASIDWNRARTPGAQIRGVVINSGNANACTGEQGVADNEEFARLAATELGSEPDQILVLSTGIIGEPLPMDKISVGAQQGGADLGADDAAFDRAALAITTTDQFVKTASRQISTPQGTITLTGMAKGAGMIGPNMATMLSIITTDALVAPADLDMILREAVDASFNCISVDGHTSTNDAVIVMASGKIPIEGSPANTLQEPMKEICIELAKQIPADGEGASHLIEVVVTGTQLDSEATAIAKTIASSPLVKTAITGADPNWGRIVSAAGYAGIDFSPESTTLRLNGTLLYSKGTPCAFDPAIVSQTIVDKREVEIELSVGEGPGNAQFWTSDLTVEYVKFNADYHT
ncbi:MAG: bifunctional glutamate N-acetyltransferase/amino-acid acetyltransferase ArgJ [Planctomycetota bacterium]|nr:bifunctional glutamate N-acetyltransferase/amino-acid acetyltransferase ArgJ [Planctomycetota bacterium]